MDFRLLSFFLSNLHLQMCTNFMIIFSASAQPITKKLVKENIHDVSTTGDSIRQRFLDFYAARGHKILPSASLVPDDPTVLLTIAGMLQFKPIFLGQVVSYPLRYWGRVEWKESEWQCYSNWYGLQNNDKNCSRKSLSSEMLGWKYFCQFLELLVENISLALIATSILSPGQLFYSHVDIQSNCLLYNHFIEICSCNTFVAYFYYL